MRKVINYEHSPDFIGYASPELIEGRVITDIGYAGGDQGGGSLGFTSFSLSETSDRDREWLVCTLFSADNWFTIGDRWVGSHPALYDQQKPLLGGNLSTGEYWDEFSPLLIGKELTQFECYRYWCKLVIGDTTVEIKKDFRKRPIHYASKSPRKLSWFDNLQRAWVLSRTSRLRAR